MRESFERRENPEIKQELLRKPAVESFLYPTQAKEVWDKSLVENPEFAQALHERQVLNERLSAVIEQLPRPDMSLQTAIEQKLLSADQVAELYDSLTPLLKNGSEYQRLALYLPFEFLPPPTTAEQPQNNLSNSSENLRQAYMQAWDNLLSVHDVRANFVDGDVLEIEARTEDLPRVVKAAHLVPKLVELGYLKTKDVLDRLEKSTDPILSKSLAEAVLVLVDLKLITQDELTRVKDKLVEIPAANQVPKAKFAGNTSQEVVENYIDQQLLAADSQVPKGVSKKRAAWLYQERERQILAAASREIESAILSDDLEGTVAAQFANPEASKPSQTAFVDGLRLAIEATTKTQPEQARKLYAEYKDLLTTLWTQGGLEEPLTKTFYHLQELGIVDEAELKLFDITVPTLDGPFSENFKSVEQDLKEVREIAKSIEQDPKLSKFIYPTVLVFGSRLKGYGSRNADLDVAVFVKPGTDLAAKTELRAKLASAFAHEKIGGQAVEFWLEETDEGLAVKDLTDYDPATGESSWTHVLFGAAWEGNPTATKELRNKLLTPYFYETGTKLHGREARGLYLEELERDTLQYRLMHKGYEKFHPPYPGLNTPHAAAVDGQSVFWDSGYRQMATKLFANRVFLPKVSREEK